LDDKSNAGKSISGSRPGSKIIGREFVGFTGNLEKYRKKNKNLGSTFGSLSSFYEGLLKLEEHDPVKVRKKMTGNVKELLELTRGQIIEEVSEENSSMQGDKDTKKKSGQRFGFVGGKGYQPSEKTGSYDEEEEEDEEQEQVPQSQISQNYTGNEEGEEDEEGEEGEEDDEDGEEGEDEEEYQDFEEEEDEEDDEEYEDEEGEDEEAKDSQVDSSKKKDDFTGNVWGIKKDKKALEIQAQQDKENEEIEETPINKNQTVEEEEEKEADFPMTPEEVEVEEIPNELPEKYNREGKLPPIRKDVRMSFQEFAIRWKSPYTNESDKAKLLQIVIFIKK